MDEILSPLSPGAREVFKAKDGMKKVRSREICTCGHSVNAHNPRADGGGTSCKSGQTPCGCMELRPVIEVDNLRHFMFSTGGTCYGLDHALSKGILMTTDNDYGFRWLVGDEAVCDKCAEVTPFPIPVAIDRITERLR